MAKNVKISKGVDIKLVGEAEKKISAISSSTVAVKPPDFHGMIPKMEVKQGDEVKAGTPLFYDKYNDAIKYVSPVSGEVAEVVRGEKRKILEVKVLADKETKYESFDTSSWNTLDADKLKDLLCKGGQWGFIRQRPYDVVANPKDTPKAIFVSTFDSAPHAPDYGYILRERGSDLQAGIDACKKLTSGKVNLVLDGRGEKGVFSNLKNCEIHSISGPHPAGNVGVQIHHIDPVNKGERVWVLNPQDLAAIGSFLNHGKIDAHRTIALTGAQVSKPQYHTVTLGSSLKSICEGNTIGDHNRYISGNVLTGDNVGRAGYLGAYAHQITVIREDHEPELFGWLAPGFDKFSLSKTFFSWLSPNKSYNLGTGLHGEERAFVMTGEYEKVFPFDILPVYLLKAMVTSDIEKMENLGVYEVAPEDFALCEFGCTSKINVQAIVRDSLDLIQKECG
ncbi:MAG: Na(+)-translocating NADH-quinone reductase subunit A [Flavobacteriales bacterium]|nr:Na(+)-translocating NADH-quinone reductase subunit A [Flavobacteriales bacterium]